MPALAQPQIVRVELLEVGVLERAVVHARARVLLRVIHEPREGEQRDPVVGAVVAQPRTGGVLEDDLGADHLAVPVDHLLQPRRLEVDVVELGVNHGCRSSGMRSCGSGCRSVGAQLGAQVVEQRRQLRRRGERCRTRRSRGARAPRGRRARPATRSAGRRCRARRWARRRRARRPCTPSVSMQRAAARARAAPADRRRRRSAESRGRRRRRSAPRARRADDDALDAERAGERIRARRRRTVDHAAGERRELERRRRLGLAQRRVALGRRLSGRARRGPCPSSTARRDHRLVLRLALGVDAVEQRSPREPAQHEVELPGEVRGVAQTRSTAPGPRNGGVRWAASPTSSTCPLRIWSASIERNSYTALRVSGPSCGRVPRLEQRPHARRDPRNPTARSPGSSMNSQRRWRGPLCTMRRRALGIAPLAGDRQVRERPHVVGLGVDDQPALLEAEIAAGDPGGLAHERVGAVGADQPPRAAPSGCRRSAQACRPRPPRPAAASARRRSSRSAEPLGFPSALDGDARLARARARSIARSSSGWKNM